MNYKRSPGRGLACHGGRECLTAAAAAESFVAGFFVVGCVLPPAPAARFGVGPAYPGAPFPALAIRCNMNYATGLGVRGKVFPHFVTDFNPTLDDLR